MRRKHFKIGTKSDKEEPKIIEESPFGKNESVHIEGNVLDENTLETEALLQEDISIIDINDDDDVETEKKETSNEVQVESSLKIRRIYRSTKIKTFTLLKLKPFKR